MMVAMGQEKHLSTHPLVPIKYGLAVFNPAHSHCCHQETIQALQQCSQKRNRLALRAPLTLYVWGCRMLYSSPLCLGIFGDIVLDILFDRHIWLKSQANRPTRIEPGGPASHNPLCHLVPLLCHQVLYLLLPYRPY